MRVIYFILFISLSVGGFAQDASSRSEEPAAVSRMLQKLRWDMSLGTSYTWFSGNGGGMTYYAAPGFSYPLTDRFSFHGGVVAGLVTGFSGVNTEASAGRIQGGFTSIYGTAAYQLNPRVVIHATGIKNIYSLNAINPLVAPSFDEISFGSTIKLSENVSIGASVHFREYNGVPGFGDGDLW